MTVVYWAGMTIMYWQGFGWAGPSGRCGASGCLWERFSAKSESFWVILCHFVAGRLGSPRLLGDLTSTNLAMEAAECARNDTGRRRFQPGRKWWSAGGVSPSSQAMIARMCAEFKRDLVGGGFRFLGYARIDGCAMVAFRGNDGLGCTWQSDTAFPCRT